MATTAGRSWSEEHFLARAEDAARSAELVVHGEGSACVEVDLIDRFGRPQRRRLSTTPLLRGSSEVHGAVLTLSDTAVVTTAVDRPA